MLYECTAMPPHCRSIECVSRCVTKPDQSISSRIKYLPYTDKLSSFWSVFNSFCVCVCRGSVGPLPVPAHLPGVAVGRSSHGLQGPVDARPLRHLQLFTGEPSDVFIDFLPPHRILCPHQPVCCVARHLSSFVVSLEPLVTPSVNTSRPFGSTRRLFSLFFVVFWRASSANRFYKVCSHQIFEKVGWLLASWSTVTPKIPWLCSSWWWVRLCVYIFQGQWCQRRHSVQRKATERSVTLQPFDALLWCVAEANRNSLARPSLCHISLVLPVLLLCVRSLLLCYAAANEMT